MMIRRIYLITLALALALGIAVCDGLRIRDKASVVAGQYEEALTQARVNDAALTLQIAKMTEIVGQANKEIAEKNAAIGHMTTAIGQKDSDLTQLVQKLHELEVNGDLPAQVANLKAQIAAWSSKFTLAQAVIAEKDKVISAWAAKYDAQVVISESWKAKYDAECRIRHLAEQGWKASERKLRWTRVMSNIKSGAILAAAGYLGLKAIKGT
jgi:chromosome segregation ATPase